MFINSGTFLTRTHIKREVDRLFNKLGYLGGEFPYTEADMKCLKHLIDISLLIEARSCEDFHISFGKFETSFILLMLVFPLFVFAWIAIMFTCKYDEARSKGHTL